MKQLKHNIIRKYLLHSFTNFLGKVVEEPDKIICYVKQNRCKKDSYYYTIACFGISEHKQKLANEYNLNKPICYILDGISFIRDTVHIWGYNNCEVIVKNCEFGFDLRLHINGTCTLDNTYIKAFSSLNIVANNLNIENMNLKNHLNSGGPLNITLESNEEIKINNSTIGSIDGKNNLTIISPQTLYLNNSNIEGEYVECIADKLITDSNSIIKTTKQLNIDIDNLQEITVNSKNINYNGNNIKGSEHPLIIKPITSPKHQKILNLIKVLNEIKSECENQKQIIIEEYNKKIQRTQIRKILTKKS